jgi:hypothetical protein
MFCWLGSMKRWPTGSGRPGSIAGQRRLRRTALRRRTRSLLPKENSHPGAPAHRNHAV